MKRNKAMFKKWIKALRSGEYAQGTDFLVYTKGNEKFDRFCCLGVLNDACGHGVYAPMKGTRYLYDGVPESITYYKQANDHYQLSSAGRRKLGITLAEQNYLMELNDAGKTFKYIADVIEEMMEHEPGYADDTEQRMDDLQSLY